MSIQQQLSQSSGMLAAVDSIRNWRAAALMLGSLVVALLVMTLGSYVTAQVHWSLGLVFLLLGVAVLFYGANAVGIMLMDEAQGLQSRPIMAALVTSLSIGHRLILLLLLVGVLYLVGLLAIVLLLFICKIPGVGPVLYTFVFPLSVVVSGLAIFALYTVIMPLAAPAIWSGVTTMQALSRLSAIARQRIVPVILSMIVLGIITMVVFGILGGIMLAGTMATSGLSAGIIGFGGMSFTNPMQMLSGYGVSGHLVAATLGGAVVWAVALTLPALVYARGCCQVYLANSQGVDVEGMEQQMRGGLDAAKRKAEEIKARGEAIAAQQKQRAAAAAAAADAAAVEAAARAAAANAAVPVAPATPAAPFMPVAPVAPIAPVAPVTPMTPVAPAVLPTMSVPAAQACPVCDTPFIAGDVFCGGCGHKLV